jgi:predicted lipid-binding transport protein (Tim44 family)
MEDLHPDLFEEWKIRVDGMRAKGERNVMDDLSLDEVRIVEVKNYRDQDKDIFTACLDAAATDYTVNESGWVVGSNTGSRRKRANNEKSHEKFREFWTFERNNKKWLLLRVDQANEWKKSVNEPLVNEQG